MSKEERENNIKYIIDLLELAPILNKPISTLSGGQKRRVDIARAMVHRPKLLILDEPTTGLDPKTRKIVWNLINKIRNETKMTVFLTTHYLEEAEKASFVTIMNKGVIIAEGTPLELKNLYAKDYLLLYSPVNKDIEDFAKKIDIPYHYSDSKGGIPIKFKPNTQYFFYVTMYGEHSNPESTALGVTIKYTDGTSNAMYPKANGGQYKTSTGQSLYNKTIDSNLLNKINKIIIFPFLHVDLYKPRNKNINI